MACSCTDLLILFLSFAVISPTRAAELSADPGSSSVVNNVTLDACTRAEKSGISMYPRDCSDLFRWGSRCTGVYLICPELYPTPFEVFCEFDQNQAWTYIMNRFDGSVNFNETWETYKNGFGSVSGEFWLGNDKIHALTKYKPMNLRVEYSPRGRMAEFMADYTNFRVLSEASKYELSVAFYDGTGHDGLSKHSGLPFSTRDNENRPNVFKCGSFYAGGFWYGKYCRASQVTNNTYLFPTSVYQLNCRNHVCMKWGIKYNLRAIKMKITNLQ